MRTVYGRVAAQIIGENPDIEKEIIKECQKRHPDANAIIGMSTQLVTPGWWAHRAEGTAVFIEGLTSDLDAPTDPEAT